MPLIDLWHRLPPLRERHEDIPALARYFLQRSARELGVEAKRLSDAAMQRVAEFDYPGNVRQLENLCHWLTVMAPAQVVEAKDLPPELLGHRGAPSALAAAAGSTLAPAATSTGSSAAPAEHPQASTAPPATLEAAWQSGSASELHSGTASESAAPTSTELDWLKGLEAQARSLLASGSQDVWEILTRHFEGRLIRTALDVTRGRRIEAAQKLGIGRNTITRKIQELGIDE